MARNFYPYPFTIAIPEETLTDLRDRLVKTRWAPDFANPNWEYGTNLAYLKELVDYWIHKYDWRNHEREMNTFSHYKTTIEDVLIHFIHEPGNGSNPIPIILSHGWPWTFWDFHKVIRPLADPAAFGGDPQDASDVVAPSLPGYGFSTPLAKPGLNFWRTADLWVKLMQDVLGEVITATEVTAGDINEAHRLIPLADTHHSNTRHCATTVVADSKYGTVENFWACHDRGLRAHIADLGEVAAKRPLQRKIFTEASLQYDPATDTYCGPAGQLLKPKSLHANRQSIDYAAPQKICAACRLREHCTQNKTGRTLKRHLRQAALDQMRQLSRDPEAKRDIRTRQHLMERSFARAKRYGFDRARWRGLWRVRIQEYLICTLQNIAVLLRYGGGPTRKATEVVQQLEQGRERIPSALSGLLSETFHNPSQGLSSYRRNGIHLFFCHPDDLFGQQPVRL